MGSSTRDPIPSRTLGWGLLSVPMAAFLILPIVMLIARADPAQTLAKLREPAAAQALALTAWTSLAATIAAVLLGSPLAYWVAKGRFRGRRIVDSLIDLPVVLPPAVAGIALLLTFGRKGPWVEWFGLEISFSAAAVVLAQLFVAAPLFVRSFAGSLSQVEPDLEEAATLDGAGPLAVARLISFPIARVGFFAGLALCWARAVGEFGATILFAGNFPGRTQTVPLAIYLGFEVDFEGAVALSAVLLAASFGVLVLVRLLQSR